MWNTYDAPQKGSNLPPSRNKTFKKNVKQENLHFTVIDELYGLNA